MCELKYNGVELTLAEAIKQAKSIRENSIIGRCLTGDQFYLLSELLKLHHRLDGSEWRDLTAVSVEKAKVYNAKSFCAHYTDGGREYFGVSSLKLSRSQRQKRAFNNAARTEVLTQTRQFFKDAFSDNQTIVCAITGEVINRDQATVDHYPIGFKTLIDDWLEINDLEWRDVEIKKHYALYVFASRKLATSWQKYHRQNARYRITEFMANHKQGNPSSRLES